ncbi:glycosyltransferase family 2 protein [Profundibacterium mesophilum]|uniref:Glycoprotein 3-alpha-L-fucosyltransferase n=1 Tax=Profundibacterium mesophilum KAUST100406-0324 TaxID=1037889 RepID=A0A921TD91_9RHOB|nr:glycosyltransferase [Profundibacterium mesophilum]KAF0675897.1 glycoprotein 3-alpha-L-fucosyltransferase [Profundibacterium mesophilum KAUST100406-0324]
MTDIDLPQISVVIPTYGRPEMVLEAVTSALSQKGPSLEVIVVPDGDDPAAIASLARIGDPRLRIVRPGAHVGNAEARNCGIRAARGTWIALLDDDDLWLEGKLAAQIEAARSCALPRPIVTCRFLARTETQEFFWPRRLPAAGEPMGDYLFRRRRPPTGDGAIQTSTILAPRALFAEVPFDPDCKRFVDIDWLLRAARAEGTGILFAAPERPMAVWRMDDRDRISMKGNWQDDVTWIEQRRDLVTPAAAAAFTLTLPSIRAARQGDRRAALALLRKARSFGQAGRAELLFHLGNFILPGRLKSLLAQLSR